MYLPALARHGHSDLLASGGAIADGRQMVSHYLALTGDESVDKDLRQH
jgi:hypothetical protein